ncbi:hypothetical protein M8C21_010720 [Ambrosia artemisiifolia]|uniref:non-specific serine/threonine protein kinase n=1 Tax=Ambrosia artemisiifolia TaxID=4212 RepID=A0AAD5GEH4_AMBAR|nr:hypothetical protein M8C21_010720 [Ambrosia artemisiifolia]
MKPRLGPGPAIIAITVVLATVIHLPVLQCQDTRLYDTCGQPAQCGDKNFEYPFWGLGRPENCGHPGFQLTCQSDVPVIVLGTVNYRVLDIESSTHTITVARDDLLSSICPQSLHNTTYDSTLFNGNNFGQDNVSLYYRCSENTVITVDNGYRFPCDVNQSQSLSNTFFVRTSLMKTTDRGVLAICTTYITVPVDRSFANMSSESDLRSALQAGFKLQWTANNDDCDGCIRSNGRCGSNPNSTSPELFACYNSGGSKGTMIRKLVIGISCSFAGIMLLLFVMLYRKLSLRVTPNAPETTNEQVESIIGSLAAKRYKYSKLKKMTNSFQEKLGQGGYGSVYKGHLPDGRLVAVKLLSEAIGNGKDFINEVASISRTSHVNIVTLLGFCFEGNKRALLYEFMPNGSLDKFIRGDEHNLDWNTLFQITKGIARGLEYLHTGCNTRIVHFDIKPHNILLDEEFVPKISDFGLAKLCKKETSTVSMTGARGTAGFMAPEVFIRGLGGASHKSDVYSYGMMILDMTGARRLNNARCTSTSDDYFPDWIYKQVEVVGGLGEYGVTTKEEEGLARKMMMVSLWCIQSNPSDRPSISKVVEMLEGSLESLQVPPRHVMSSLPMPLPGTPSSMQSSRGDIASTVEEPVKTSLLDSHEDS